MTLFVQGNQVGVDTRHGHVESVTNSVNSPVQGFDNFIQSVQTMSLTIDDLMMISLDLTVIHLHTIHLYHNHQSSF